MRLTTLSKAFLILMLLFAAACDDESKGSDDDTGSESDSYDTMSTDSQSSEDTASSVTTDTSSNSTTDTGTGSAADTASDSDTPVDTGSTADTAVDTMTDTAIDTGSDTVQDSDSVVDTATDSMVDTGTEAPPVDPDVALEHLITVFCQWEFSCCSTGERAYRLSTAYDSVETCVARLQYELTESNDTYIPLHLAGSPMTIVPQIAYTVDLSKVIVNGEGVEACAAMLETVGCNAPIDASATASCAEGVSTADANPCVLAKMFDPGLDEGDQCTNDPSLFEGMTNDIECMTGTSCVPPGAPDNPGTQAMCVNRGLDGAPCTMGANNCDFGLYCDSGWCTPKADVGEACAYKKDNKPVVNELSVSCKLGLTCNPALDATSNGAGLCVAPCSTGSLCTVDAECPAGQSCAPISVGNDSASFSACRPLGSGATHRCDSHEDCVTTSHCNASGVCAADATAGGSCTEDAQCPEGTFCDAGTCAAWVNPGDACTRDATSYEAPECGPDTVGCIYDVTLLTTICSTAKLENGITCLADYDCASGLCEQTTESGTVDDMVCYAGARDGDACDDDPATFVDNQTRCAPGLECDATTNLCYALLGPGDDCETEAGGAPDTTLCATVCSEVWGEYMCSDGPVSELDGGTGVICDGAEI